jgi:hypothetical protein
MSIELQQSNLLQSSCQPFMFKDPVFMEMATLTASLQGPLRFILNNYLLAYVLGKRGKHKNAKSDLRASASVLDAGFDLHHEDDSPIIQMHPGGQDLVSQLEIELTNHLRSNFTQPITILDSNEEEDVLVLKLPCLYPKSSKNYFKKFSKLRISKTKAWKEAKKFRKDRKRTSHLPELDNKNYMIYIGEDDTPSAIHLRQALSEDAAFGQKACVALMAEEGGHGWMKGCAAEGKMRYSLLMAALKKTAALKASGYHRLQKIKVSKPQGSGKACYINKHNEPKSFQIGQLLMREKVQWKKKDSALEYFKHLAVKNLHQEFIPCIQTYFDEIAGILRTHAKHFLVDKALLDATAGSTEWPAKFDLSINFVSQYLSRLANHLDPASKFPALFTVCNPLDFKTEWSGGELLLTEPAFVVDYVERDVVLLAGATTWHAVLPLTPAKGSKQPIRVSLAHFNNS